MPALTAPAKILVTGASGFIATHVVKAYLSQGFSVRGTVRSPARGEYLRSLFEPGFPGKFEYIVADIEKPADIDAAVQGVDGIAHVASPFFIPEEGSDPQDIIRPAVNGTVHVLESAAKVGGIKRIVVTGSIVSVLQPHPSPYTYTSKDWNDYVVQEVKDKGPQASGFFKYIASKVLAERAAVKFVEEHKPSFDIAHVLPTYVYGPVLGDVKSIDDLSVTPKRLFGFFAQGVEDVDGNADSFIDVRDVARAHVAVHTREELGGSRRHILSSKGGVTFQDFYDAYWSLPAAERPKLPFAVPKGKPGSGDAIRHKFNTFETAEEELGWTFAPLPEVVKDTLATIAAKVFRA